MIGRDKDKGPTQGPASYRYRYPGESCSLGERKELDDLHRLVNATDRKLTVYIKGQDGGGGVKYWDELKKRSQPNVTALDAFGDWRIEYESLAEHVNKYIDPHSNHPEWTVGVKTPLVDANQNLQLLPASRYQVTVGDTNTGGVYRPVVIADAAYQTRNYAEAFKVARTGSPTTTNDVLSYFYYEPTNTDSANQFNASLYILKFSGSSICKSNTEVLDLGMQFATSGTFPAVSNDRPMTVLGIVPNFMSSYSGSLPELNGILLEPFFDTDASGSITALNMIKGQSMFFVPDASLVTTACWINLASWPANVTNPYHFILGAGNWRLDGNQSFYDSSKNSLGSVSTGGDLTLAKGELFLTAGDNQNIVMGGGTDKGRIVDLSSVIFDFTKNVDRVGAAYVKDTATGYTALVYRMYSRTALTDACHMWYTTGVNDSSFNIIMQLTGEGKLDIDSDFSIAGTRILTSQQAHISNAVTSHATANFPQVNAALNNLGTKINSILSMVETHGLVATS